jgi:hypothetical protein
VTERIPHPTQEPRLFAEHERVLLDRAIPIDYAQSLGICSLSPQQWPWLQRDYPGLGQYPTNGLVIPYQHPADGTPRVRVRPDVRSYTIHADPGRPGEVEREVEIPRYVAQAGVSVIPYLRCVERMAEDASVPLYITEAPLKAVSLSAHGFPAVGLGGVVAGAHATDVLRYLQEIVAHPEMRRINWNGRRVFVVFDAGLSDNPNVAQGMAFTTIALQREGADVWLVRLPHERPDVDLEGDGRFFDLTDQGPDDFIARRGVDAFRALVDAAVPADPAARFRLVLAETTDKAARAARLVELLRELAVQAMLHTGGAVVIDSAGAVTKGVVGKRALQGAAREFADRLARRVGVDPHESATAAVDKVLSTIPTAYSEAT